MAPKMGEGGQIWLKCITGDLIMMIRDKNNIFERVLVLSHIFVNVVLFSFLESGGFSFVKLITG